MNFLVTSSKSSGTKFTTAPVNGKNTQPSARKSYVQTRDVQLLYNFSGKRQQYIVTRVFR